MSPSGIHLNKAVVVVIVGLFVGVIAVYRFLHAPKSKTMADTGNTVSITLGDKTLPIYTQSSKPAGVPKFDILFLHGSSFTSQNWVVINTLKLASDAGYNAVAVDLPGYGKSSKVKVDDKVKFMEALIAGLKLSKPVIVSPSMSGSFSLPFLFSDPESATTRAQGFVAVAPVQTTTYKDKYSKSQIPTLIVFGSRDTNLGAESKTNLQALPKKKILMIEGAGHACYLDNPAEFHKGLFDFLSTLSK
ncbi:protein ABHD14B-like [Gigantopelta aegis]|uniref:protein ABHD14B-like n=1 Tax=Gigantopelta aegis TaxID=1735272 RepID=UPI001B88C81A|nr:protein ABHD14B-like [Gigantopelta aegis]